MTPACPRLEKYNTPDAGIAKIRRYRHGVLLLLVVFAVHGPCFASHTMRPFVVETQVRFFQGRGRERRKVGAEEKKPEPVAFRRRTHARCANLDPFAFAGLALPSACLPFSGVGGADEKKRCAMYICRCTDRTLASPPRAEGTEAGASRSTRVVRVPAAGGV